MIRVDFSTPAKPEPPMDVALDATIRRLDQLSAAFRRQGACPQLVTVVPRRTWRWACMPAYPPLNGEYH